MGSGIQENGSAIAGQGIQGYSPLSKKYSTASMSSSRESATLTSNKSPTDEEGKALVPSEIESKLASPTSTATIEVLPSSATVTAQQLLPTSVLRNLYDKLYEKRKAAALEVEQIVKSLAGAGDLHRVHALLSMLVRDYALSALANHRKGGLIGLAAATVGLVGNFSTFLPLIVPPVLRSFNDADSRVRYYACEALYNMAKVAREDFVHFFNDVFDALCKLSADVDPNVQNAAHLLDKLVKDIVTESPHFNIEDFIKLLRARLQVSNPYVRQFLVGWISVLDSVPDIDMLEYLPDFLGGLFNMLSDPNRDIRQQADAVLGEFLSEIKAQNASEDSDETRSNFDFGSIIKILVSKANHTDEFTQLTALAWLHDFVKIAGTQLITYFAEVLDAVLPCLSHHNHRMCQVAQNTNEALLELDTACVKTLDSLSAIKVIKKHLEKCEHGERSSTNLEGYDKSEKTWLEALKWLSVLLKRYHAEVLSCLEELLPLLLNATADGSETVVLQALEVQAIIAKKKADFKRLISALLDRFRGKEGMELLQERGGLVIRRLCSLLGAESIYRTLSSLLKQEKDLPFASRMVQALNLILLTAPELSGPRNMLKDLAHCEGGAHLFCALYNSWCHSAGATLSLCLLAGVYNHACDLIASMGSLDINVNTLMEMDRLVSLLESPIYAGLRLKLLEPARHPSLFKALYGLLAILPQSKAFSTLNDRIRSIPSIELLQLNSLMDRGLSHSHSHSWSFKGSKNASREIEIDKKDKEKRRDHSEMNFVELLHMFVQCQQRHIEFESKQSSKRQ